MSNQKAGNLFKMHHHVRQSDINFKIIKTIAIRFLTPLVSCTLSGQWTRRAQISSVEAKGSLPVTSE